jgi:hypothetical protein
MGQEFSCCDGNGAGKAPAAPAADIMSLDVETDSDADDQYAYANPAIRHGDDSSGDDGFQCVLLVDLSPPPLPPPAHVPFSSPRPSPLPSA